MTTTTYIVHRTSRRACPVLVSLLDGQIVRLNARGAHVFDLTPADAERLAALPDTRVTPVRDAAAPPPPPKAAAPRKRRKRRGKS